MKKNKNKNKTLALTDRPPVGQNAPEVVINQRACLRDKYFLTHEVYRKQLAAR